MHCWNNCGHPPEIKLPPFPFLEEKRHVISLVGAGGKTTLMYAMAAAYCRLGCRVLVTTTTHIRRPADGLRARSPKEAQRLWQEHTFAVAGADAPEGKLGRLAESELQWYIRYADIVLVEADGAKGMPCKVPAAHEPVIPEESDIVVGVAGLDSIGRPLQEVCFRLERAEQLLGRRPGETLTGEDMAEILSSDEGTRKGVGSRDYYVVLNKCTDEGRRRSAEKVAGLLRCRGIARVGIT